MLNVTTFYHFVRLAQDDLPEHRNFLLTAMIAANIKGTIYVAEEGFNATLCGEDDAVHEYVAALKDHFQCDFQQTISYAHNQAFKKSKVKIKPTLVKIGVDLQHPDQVGTYIEPQDWNAFISRDDVTVIDARNTYETYLGTFKNAYDPKTRKFNQITDMLPEAVKQDKSKKIATFCTGGIRCEKYTALLKEQGYDEVYHLKGGILKYLAEIPEQQSLWEGSCYVFDDRVAVKHGLEVDAAAGSCPACGHTLQAMDLRSVHYIAGVQCRHCDSFPPANYDLLEGTPRYQK
jgi:UPF0176 protein